MINSIGTTNPIQMLNALNAFKGAEAKPEAMPIQDVSDGIDINNIDILKDQNLNEIREMAKVSGEESLSDDDIKYGLTYGRSVIADYIA